MDIGDKVVSLIAFGKPIRGEIIYKDNDFSYIEVKTRKGKILNVFRNDYIRKG